MMLFASGCIVIGSANYRSVPACHFSCNIGIGGEGDDRVHFYYKILCDTEYYREIDMCIVIPPGVKVKVSEIKGLEGVKWRFVLTGDLMVRVDLSYVSTDLYPRREYEDNMHPLHNLAYYYAWQIVNRSGIDYRVGYEDCGSLFHWRYR